MTIKLEINPPKILYDSLVDIEKIQNSVEMIKQRVFEISAHCNGVHITDSVLGITRLSPINVGSILKNESKRVEVSVSIRVRDRNIISVTQSVCDAILLGLDGILILKGDPPPKGPKDSKLIPSEIVKSLKEEGFNKKIDFFLSLPTKPNYDKIQKKIEAQPTGFITQVIEKYEQVADIVDKLKPQGFRIVPCILLPSEKNKKSAEFLNLDWSSYEDNVADFVKSIHKLTGEVLLTSPNDFHTARKTIAELEKYT